MKIILDFKNVKVKQDIFDIFQNAFVFAFPPKGFDSLEDSLSSLDTESEIFIKNKGNIQVVIRNMKALKKNLSNESKIVSELIKIVQK